MASMGNYYLFQQKSLNKAHMKSDSDNHNTYTIVENEIGTGKV